MCRKPEAPVDLFFDSHGVVEKIRVHRRGRVPEPARGGVRRPKDLLWITDSGITLDAPLSKLPQGLAEPIRKEKRKDPAFGELEVWVYPGLEVEIEYNKTGEGIVGGFVVKK